MKIILLLLLSTASFSQKKNDSLPSKHDSSYIIMNQFLIFLQDKVTVRDYLPIQQAITAFLQSKEFVKPKE